MNTSYNRLARLSQKVLDVTIYTVCETTQEMKVLGIRRWVRVKRPLLP